MMQMMAGSNPHRANQPSRKWVCFINQRRIERIMAIKGEGCHGPLTRCILVDSSTVICWTDIYHSRGVGSILSLSFYFLMANPVRKRCRP